MYRGSASHHSSLAVKASALALPLAILLLATPATSQLVVGRVVDASDDSAVGDVTITLVDTLAAARRSVVSNAAGYFIVAITPPGTYLLRASRLGYATTETSPIEIEEGEVVEVEVRLDVEPVELEALTVVVRRRETQRERELREHFERVARLDERHLGSTVYTREILQQWDAFSLGDAFRYHLRWRPFGLNCNPKVFVDGKQHYGAFLEDLAIMPVSNVEGLELYGSSGPPESRFWDPDGCGVVLVWTRALPEGRGGLSGLEVLAVAGTAVILTLLAAWTIF